jgi:hypothetical protein
MAKVQQIDPQKHEGLAGYPGAFFEESDNDMLGEELIGIETSGLFLGGNRKNTVYPLT